MLHVLKTQYVSRMLPGFIASQTSKDTFNRNKDNFNFYTVK